MARRTRISRIADKARNIVAELHGEVGDIEAGFEAADIIHEATYVSQRVQHAHLETHGCIGWRAADGRLTLRTSSQTPFLTRDALCALYDLPREKVRVFTERVGGGFGGKQEMLVEDIVALAVLRTGRPVKLEYTRPEQFAASTSRHPMRVSVKLGATRDGRLTAISMRMLSNTGAYGNHAAGVLFHGAGECIALYRCPNKRVDGYAVYTHTLPSGAFRGYGLSQTNFAVESALDELAGKLGLDPFTLRRLNVVTPGDAMVSWSQTHHDVEIGSYGLDQCLDAVEEALSRALARAIVRRLADRARHGGGDDRHHPAARPCRPDAPAPHHRGPLRAADRHRRVRQRHDDGACADRRHRARRIRRADRRAPVRHRACRA